MFKKIKQKQVRLTLISFFKHQYIQNITISTRNTKWDILFSVYDSKSSKYIMYFMLIAYISSDESDFKYSRDAHG